MGRNLGDQPGPEDSAGVQQGARERSVCGASDAGVRGARGCGSTAQATGCPRAAGPRQTARPKRKDLTAKHSWPVRKFVLTE